MESIVIDHTASIYFPDGFSDQDMLEAKSRGVLECVFVRHHEDTFRIRFYNIDRIVSDIQTIAAYDSPVIIEYLTVITSLSLTFENVVSELTVLYKRGYFLGSDINSG
jgi:hypothetical protein